MMEQEMRENQNKKRQEEDSQQQQGEQQKHQLQQKRQSYRQRQRQQQHHHLIKDNHHTKHQNEKKNNITNFNNTKQKQRQNSKDQKQKPFSDNQSQHLLSQTNDQQIVGFNIIGQEATNQILQINLYPKQYIFIRGKILYANFDYKNKTQFVGYQTFSQFIKELIHSGFHPMRKLHNSKSHIVYAGISKGGGKLLTIDNDIYGNDIFVNPAKIILSNTYHGNSTIKKHPNLKRFLNRLKVNQKHQQTRTLVVLQSLNNNVIVEKYLGAKQKLYVEERLIVGLSGTVKGESGFGRLGTAKLQGPGWVFMENESNSWLRENKLIIMGMVMILFWMVSYLIGVNRQL